MKFNWFRGFGRGFGTLGLMYAVLLRMHYGSGMPKSTEEWVAEFIVAFLLVAGAAFYAVGKHFVKES